MAAYTISRLNHQNKTFYAVGLVCLMLFVQKGGATEFTVGGSKGWHIPEAEDHYNQWAENSRFQIGDTLVFVYPSDQDSVLHVNQDDYTNCNIDSPVEPKFSDGHTVYKFSQSGAFYFISGNKDRCLKNEKLVVVVLADRSNNNNNTNQTSPASPPPSETPPSPAPSGEESPSPPEGTNPTPAPSSETPPSPPPPSGASSISMGSIISSLGAFTASSLLVLF